MREKSLAILDEQRYNLTRTECRCSSSVEHQLPKLGRRVRFPSSAWNFLPEDAADAVFPGDFLSRPGKRVTKGANYNSFISLSFSFSFSFSFSVMCKYISRVTRLFACPSRREIVSISMPCSISKLACVPQCMRSDPSAKDPFGVLS